MYFFLLIDEAAPAALTVRIRVDVFSSSYVRSHVGASRARSPAAALPADPL